MGEASLWVAGGLAVASVLHHPAAMPSAYPASGWGVLGGALLGFGAWVGRACVFGAIARFGSGEWNYAATPLGFFAGCVTLELLFGRSRQQAAQGTSPVLQQPAVAALLFACFALWRLWPALRIALARPLRELPRSINERVWSPHAATGVIGVTFLALLLSVGAWAYTDVLAQLAHGMTMRLAAGAVLLLALYLGAVLGGWTAGRVSRPRVDVAGLVRCFAGGVLMAWGSQLIPGSNDGLVLVGMPMLRPYAWLAFASMGLTIAASMLAARRFAGGPPGRSVA
jgi:toxin CptA